MKATFNFGRLKTTKMKEAGLHFVGRYAKSVALLLVAILILSQFGCGGEHLPPQPYLVLYALEAEGKLIGEQMSVRRIEKHLGRPVMVGQISGKDVVLAESGIGMVNAAMTAQKMIDYYNPQGVIMTGIAGSLDSTVHVGDIVVCGNWIEHDYGYVGNDGFEPMALWVYLPDEDSLRQTSGFPVDEAMLSVAERLSNSALDLEKIGPRHPQLLVGGVGVSGNTFIDSEEKRQWLSQQFGALITDMESAAVAQVCAVNGLPFIVFRSASDLAGGSGSETAQNELNEFFKIAAGNSSKVVIRFLKEL